MTAIIDLKNVGPYIEKLYKLGGSNLSIEYGVDNEEKVYEKYSARDANDDSQVDPWEFLAGEAKGAEVADSARELIEALQDFNGGDEELAKEAKSKLAMLAKETKCVAAILEKTARGVEKEQRNRAVKMLVSIEGGLPVFVRILSDSFDEKNVSNFKNDKDREEFQRLCFDFLCSYKYEGDDFSVLSQNDKKLLVQAIQKHMKGLIEQGEKPYDWYGVALLTGLHNVAMPVLLELLATEDDEVQDNLANGIACINPIVYPLLVRGLNNPNSRVKLGVLKVMNRTVDRSTFPDKVFGIEAFMPFIEARDVALRVEALDAIYRRVELLDEESFHYQSDIKSLKEAQPTLRRLLSSDDENTRSQALKILGEIPKNLDVEKPASQPVQEKRADANNRKGFLMRMLASEKSSISVKKKSAEEFLSLNPTFEEWVYIFRQLPKDQLESLEKFLDEKGVEYPDLENMDKKED